MKSFLVDQDGYYGEFGGAYVPEILHKCVEELKNTFKTSFKYVLSFLFLIYRKERLCKDSTFYYNIHMKKTLKRKI